MIALMRKYSVHHSSFFTQQTLLYFAVTSCNKNALDFLRREHYSYFGFVQKYCALRNGQNHLAVPGEHLLVPREHLWVPI